MKIKLLIIFIISIVFNITSSSQVYKLNLKEEAIHIGVGTSLSIIAQVIQNNNDVPSVEDVMNLDRNQVWFFDRGATLNNSTRAQDLSDMLLYGSATLPFITYFSKKCRVDGVATAVMALETLLYVNGVTQLTKGLTQRYRPSLYNDEIAISDKLNSGSRKSFFSGHASATSAYAFLSARIITDVHPDMKHKWAVWTLASTIPAVVGYLRYEAGKHFPTDVMLGYAVGAVIGYGIPEIHLSNQLEIGFVGNGFKLQIALN